MDWKIYILLFLTVAPIFWGFGLWIYGRAKGNRKMRHNGFIMMMLSFLLIFLVVFTIGATLFYLYLTAGSGAPGLSSSVVSG